MSDAAVRAKTGRTWKQWARWLDASGAHQWRHREIARYVQSHHDIGGWWAQTVTVGYERIRGLRDIHQRRGGAYDANRSKTLPVPLPTLYAAFADARKRQRWLPDSSWTITTKTPHKSLRIACDDGSRLDIHFEAKEDGKSRVAIQHRGLKRAEDVARVKRQWSSRFERLERAIVG